MFWLDKFWIGMDMVYKPLLIFAHLEKIAISKDFQKKHLSIKLIEELYQRLRIKKLI